MGLAMTTIPSIGSRLLATTVALCALVTFAAPPAQAQDLEGAAPAPAPRIHVPKFGENIDPAKGAIFWLGQVDPTTNYTDVRLGYNDDRLIVVLHTFDQQLWYPDNGQSDLTAWDSADLYLNLAGPQGNTPGEGSYRFTAVAAPAFEDRSDLQRTERGGSGSWSAAPVPFESESTYRGIGYNDGSDIRGWIVSYTIPFASLGLSGAPPAGTVWGLAVSIHDRDDAGGTAIPVVQWPPGQLPEEPATWAEIVFGAPSFSPPAAAPSGTTTIRHDVDGATVIDAAVGGHSLCGTAYDPNFFDGWGSANYAGYDQFNIQNQWDVADWPCFSRYYVTFPMTSIPAGKRIISATLTLLHFGNASPDEATASHIQVGTVATGWDEATVTWNNAPLLQENVSWSTVEPIKETNQKVERYVTWDVSLGVAQAYAAGMPLRLVLYSSDGDYHSGKYFWSSDADSPEGRPALTITWGDEALQLTLTPAVQLLPSGGQTAFTLQVSGVTEAEGSVQVSAGPSSPPGLAITVEPPAVEAPGGQVSVVVADTHAANFAESISYTVPIVATGLQHTAVTTATVIMNPSIVYLPLVDQ